MIESPSNDKVKLVKRLLCSKKERKRNQMFVIEGVRLCYDAVLSGAEILMTFYTDSVYKKNKEKLSYIIGVSEASYLINENVAFKMSDTYSCQGVFCVVTLCNDKVSLNKGQNIIVLENIQDPLNLGTILRSADALGIKDVVVSKGCVDVYSPKVLRGSMGAVFRLRVSIVDDVGLFIQKLSVFNIKAYATVANKQAIKITDVDFQNRSALIFGNEANGLSNKVLMSCKAQVTIPMKGQTESFNVAVAASIAMWEMVK